MEQLLQTIEVMSTIEKYYIPEQLAELSRRSPWSPRGPSHRTGLEELLDGIVQHQFHTASLDVTGVKNVGAESADALLRIARAARLLGARLVLTGIGPDTAQILVDLGVDLAGIITRSTLQSGIAHALAPRARSPRGHVKGTPVSPARLRPPA